MAAKERKERMETCLEPTAIKRATMVSAVREGIMKQREGLRVTHSIGRAVRTRDSKRHEEWNKSESFALRSAMYPPPKGKEVMQSPKS